MTAMLYSCALCFGELHLNGRRLDNTERDPTSMSGCYVTHDVTTLIRDGDNAVGAILGTGWYDTHDVATWHMNTAPWR